MKEFGSVPKGALLFIREDVSASTPGKFRSDGIGDITHMGVKTGRGDGAIHSSHSRGCVCTSKFRDRTIPNGGWNRVGLLNVFSYGKTVDWVLEHGGWNEGTVSAVPRTWNEVTVPDVPSRKEAIPMKGTVTAMSGSTVKLRQKPGTDCPIYWDIPVGTEMEIVDQRENWSKCICSGLTGWMKNEFIRTGGEEDLPIAPEPSVSEYPVSDPEPEQALTLLAGVYQTLQDLCERIIGTIGRG